MCHSTDLSNDPWQGCIKRKHPIQYKTQLLSQECVFGENQHLVGMLYNYLNVMGPYLYGL